MISVDNFYAVLYELLLKPLDIDCRYYYPFGTTHNLSGSEFGRWPRHMNDHHVLFHYDQEPIYDVNDRAIVDGTLTNRLKAVRIMAMGEISPERTAVRDIHDVIDWYYFYHGFAALDWFRDSVFFAPSFNVNTHYLSFNHLVRHRRSYRMSLTARLIENDLDRFGLISFHGTEQDCRDEITAEFSRLSDTDRERIGRYLLPQPLPLTLDKGATFDHFSASFGYHEHALWTAPFLHVVNETVFYEPKLHLTEKVFKPIVSCRPFLLVAAPGNLQYLRSYGFQSFGKWIDESYDQETDHDRRLAMIVHEVNKICQLTRDQLQDLLMDMAPVLEYNKNHFFGEFKRTIVHELVDNWDQCIRRWNNGRVSRHMPLPQDLDRVKTLMMNS